MIDEIREKNNRKRIEVFTLSFSLFTRNSGMNFMTALLSPRFFSSPINPKKAKMA